MSAKHNVSTHEIMTLPNYWETTEGDPPQKPKGKLRKTRNRTEGKDVRNP